MLSTKCTYIISECFLLKINKLEISTLKQITTHCLGTKNKCYSYVPCYITLFLPVLTLCNKYLIDRNKRLIRWVASLRHVDVDGFTRGAPFSDESMLKSMNHHLINTFSSQCNVICVITAVIKFNQRFSSLTLCIEYLWTFFV